jgi:hypothetical protein
MPLQEEERLFIDAIRDLNNKAGKLQQEEKADSSSIGSVESPIDNTLISANAHTSEKFDRDETQTRRKESGLVLSAATANVFEAAKKLNSNHAATASLHPISSWTEQPSSTRPIPVNSHPQSIDIGIGNEYSVDSNISYAVEEPTNSYNLEKSNPSNYRRKRSLSVAD